MPSPTPRALRERILKAYQQGTSSTVELARRFAISQPTVWRLLQRFKEENTISPKPHGGGRPPDLTPHEMTKLDKLAKNNPTSSSKEMGEQLRRGKKKQPREWTIQRALKKLGYTHKKASFEAKEKSRPDVKRRYREFLKRAKKTDSAKLVFLDETGIDRSMRHLKVWTKPGSQTKVQRPGAGLRRVRTVIGAMRSTGLVGMQTLRGAMKKRDFLRFISKILCPRLHPGDIVVMDNLNSHHSAEACELIRQRGAAPTFLPPYSPELNPIELLWSNLKRELSKKLRGAVRQIGQKINGAWQRLRRLDLSRFLPACGYSLCIQPKCS